MKNSSVYTLFFVVIFLTNNCLADILFLNFNRNTSAVKAAQRAARTRGERLIVLPPSPRPRDYKLNPDQLTSELENIRRQHIVISSVVFSGHDGGGFFSGHDGTIESFQVNRIMRDFPDIAASVKTLVLRGCYSATLNQVQEGSSWRQAFPNLHLIAGWEGRAPSSERQSSKEYVEDILTLAPQLVAAADATQVTRLYRQIGLYDTTHNAAWIRTCQDSFYMRSEDAAHNRDPFSFSDMSSLCSSKRSEFEEKKQIIESYFYAVDDAHQNPPSNTSSSELRSAYSMLRQWEHCLKPEYLGALADSPMLNPDMIIRLIFFKNVAGNFARLMDLPGLQAAIGAFWTPPMSPLTLPDFRHATRAQVNHWITSLGEFTAQAQENFSHLPVLEQTPEKFRLLAKLRLAYSLSNNILHRLEPEYLPFSWVEPGSTTQSRLRF